MLIIFPCLGVDKTKCVKVEVVVGQNVNIIVITLVVYRYDLISNKLAHKLNLLRAPSGRP